MLAAAVETGDVLDGATTRASVTPAAAASDARSVRGASSPKKTSAGRRTNDVAARGRARAGELADGAHAVARAAPRVGSLSARMYTRCDGVARDGKGRG